VQGSDQTGGIGTIGAGNILRRYLKGMSRFPNLRVIGCATRSGRERRWWRKSSASRI
jgi:hypothetical protein